MVEKLTLDLAAHKTSSSRLKNRSNLLVSLRAALGIAILLLIYYAIKYEPSPWLWAIESILIMAFILVVIHHGRVDKNFKFSEALVDIHEQELRFLNLGISPNSDGQELRPANHDFANDLDIFGKQSLFAHINRSHTALGNEALARLLSCIPEDEEILSRQIAIKELSLLHDFRMHLRARTLILGDNATQIANVKNWMTSPVKKVNALSKVLSFLLPLLFIIAATLFFSGGGELYYNISILLFIANLANVASFFKEIKKLLLFSDNIEKCLGSYASIIYQIENEEFKSPHLLSAQAIFINENGASSKLRQLAGIFNNLNTAANPLGVIITSGIFQFHLHTYRSLIAWKEKHGDEVYTWFERIGEFEALVSIGNFAANNVDFAYPDLNYKGNITMLAMGHPLITKAVRVSNDLDLRHDSFIILTGSNMAGKSTFLRTIGVNMVLSAIGAPVCATSANIDPCHLLVSMGISDSLGDNQSYFFAEVLRLKYILDKVQSGPCLIMLDEILRGTNSDDKTSGTLEYIKQLIGNGGRGILATHDLEVCKIQTEFPDKISNNHFASDIVNDQLYFDYKLKEGVCESRNATFLMKKYGIIG